MKLHGFRISKKILRIQTAALCVVFSWTTTAWSVPEFGWRPHPEGGAHHAAPSSLPFGLPEHIGTVEEVYRWGPNTFSSERGAQRVFILIRDAHGNISAQRHIGQTVSFLVEKLPEPPLILLEGAAGTVDTSLVSRHPDEKVKRKVAENLFSSGQIDGVERLSMIERPDLDLDGIEDPPLYRANLAAALAVLSGQKKILPRVEKIEKALSGLTEYVCSPELAHMLKRITDHRRLRQTAPDYFQWLTGQAEKRGVSRARFPELSRLDSMAGKKGEDYAGIMRRLDGRALLAEMEQLEEVLLDQAVTTVKERSFVRFLKHAILLKRAVQLELTPLEARYFLAYHDEFREELFLDFLAHENRSGILKESIPGEAEECESRSNTQHGANDIESAQSPRKFRFGTAPDNSRGGGAKITICGRVEYKTGGVRSVDDLLPSIRRFYECVFKRDEALYKRMIEQAQRQSVAQTIVIAGGFHTAGIAKRLRKEKMPFVVITPRIEDEVDQDFYRTALIRLALFEEETMRNPRLFDTRVPSLLITPRMQRFVPRFLGNVAFELGHPAPPAGFGGGSDEEPPDLPESIQKWQREIERSFEYVTYAATAGGFIEALERKEDVEDLLEYAEIFLVMLAGSDEEEQREAATDAERLTAQNVDADWWKARRVDAYRKATEALEEAFSDRRLTAVSGALDEYFNRLQSIVPDIKGGEAAYESIARYVTPIEESVEHAAQAAESLEARFRGSAEAGLYSFLLKRTTDRAGDSLERIKLRWFKYYESLAVRELEAYRTARKLLFMSPVIPGALAKRAKGDMGAEQEIIPYLKPADVTEGEYRLLLERRGVKELSDKNKDEFLKWILESAESFLQESGRYLGQAGAIRIRRGQQASPKNGIQKVAAEVRPHQNERSLLGASYLALSNAWAWMSQGRRDFFERARKARTTGLENYDLSLGGGAAFALSTPLDIADIHLDKLDFPSAMEALQENLHLPSLQFRTKVPMRSGAETFRYFIAPYVLVRFLATNLNRRYSRWNELFRQAMKISSGSTEPTDEDLQLFEEALAILKSEAAPESIAGTEGPARKKTKAEQSIDDLLSVRGRKMREIFRLAIESERPNDPDFPSGPISAFYEDINRTLEQLEKLERLREKFKKEGWDPAAALDQLFPNEPILRSSGASARDQALVSLAVIYWSGVLFWDRKGAPGDSGMKKVHHALGYVITDGLLFRDRLREHMVSAFELPDILKRNSAIKRLRLNPKEWSFLLLLFDKTLAPKVDPLYEELKNVAALSPQISQGDLLDQLISTFSDSKRQLIRHIFGSNMEELKVSAYGYVSEGKMMNQVNPQFEFIIGFLHRLLGIERPVEEEVPLLARRIPEVEEKLKQFEALSMIQLESRIRKAYFFRFFSWVLDIIFRFPPLRWLVGRITRKAKLRLGIDTSEGDLKRDGLRPTVPFGHHIRSVLPDRIFRFMDRSGLLDVGRIFVVASVMLAARTVPQAWIQKHEAFFKKWAGWSESPLKALREHRLGQIRRVLILRRELVRLLEDLYVQAHEYYRLNSRRKIRRIDFDKPQAALIDSIGGDLNAAENRLRTAVELSKLGARMDAELTGQPPPDKRRHAHAQRFVELGRAKLHYMQTMVLHPGYDDEALSSFYRDTVRQVNDFWKEPFRVTGEEEALEKLQFELIDGWLIPFNLRNAAVEFLVEAIQMDMDTPEKMESAKSAIKRFLVLEKVGPKAWELGTGLDAAVEEIQKVRRKPGKEARGKLIGKREERIRRILSRAERDQDISEQVEQALSWGQALILRKKSAWHLFEKDLASRLHQSNGKVDISLINELAKILAKGLIHGEQALSAAEVLRKTELTSKLTSRIGDRKLREIYDNAVKRSQSGPRDLRPPPDVPPIVALAMIFASRVLEREGAGRIHEEIGFIFRHGLLWKDRNRHDEIVPPGELKRAADQYRKFIEFIGDEKPLYDSMMSAAGLYPSKGFGAARTKTSFYRLFDPDVWYSRFGFLGDPGDIKSGDLMVKHVDFEPVEVEVAFDMFDPTKDEESRKFEWPIKKRIPYHKILRALANDFYEAEYDRRDSLLRRVIEDIDSARFGAAMDFPGDEGESRLFQQLRLVLPLTPKSDYEENVLADLVYDPVNRQHYIFRYTLHPTPELSLHLSNEIEVLKVLNANGLRADIPQPLTELLSWKAVIDEKNKTYHIDPDENLNIVGYVVSYLNGRDIYHMETVLNEWRTKRPDLLWKFVYTSAQTLAFVHSKGYIHGDISPANVIVRGNKEDEISAGLIDFGIARPIGYAATQRQKLVFGPRDYSERSLVGKQILSATPEYWSVPSYDIFSWGATIFRVLTEKSPYAQGPEINWQKNLAESDYAPIISKSMDIDRGKRYASMNEVAADLYALGLKRKYVAGFGATDTAWEQRVSAFLRSSAFAGRAVDSEAAMTQLGSWTASLRQTILRLNSTPKVILTGFNNLPEDRSVLERFTRNGGEWLVAYEGTWEAGVAAFKSKYKVSALWEGIVIVNYSKHGEVSDKSMEMFRQYERQGIRYENMLAFFGEELRDELKELPALILRIYDAPLGVHELKWDTVLALASLGPNDPAVRPFLTKENGFLRLVTIEELAERLVAVGEFAAAA